MEITFDDLPVYLGRVVKLSNKKTPEVIFARVKDTWENNAHIFFLSGFLTETDRIITKLARNPNYTITVDSSTELVEQILLNVLSKNNR